MGRNGSQAIVFMSVPRDAQPSRGMGDLTFPGVSKQHILCHCTLQNDNQMIALIRMMGGMAHTLMADR